MPVEVKTYIYLLFYLFLLSFVCLFSVSSEIFSASVYKIKVLV